MLQILKKLFSFATVWSLFACTTPYYGYNADAWAAFSEQEQLMIKAEYAPILKLREEQKHADILEQRQQQIIKRGMGNK